MTYLEPCDKFKFVSIVSFQCQPPPSTTSPSSLGNECIDFSVPPSSLTAEDYDSTTPTPFRTLDCADYQRFKRERQITTVTEDENSADSENIIINV